MITVMGANGNTGRAVVEALLRRREAVRGIGRDRTKLARLVKLGAEIKEGDISDARFLADAFRGSSAVYTLIPPNFTVTDVRKFQDEIGTITVQAIENAKVKRVVLLSSIGAQPSGVGPIAGVHAQEQRLRGLSDVDVLALRPGYFFQNFLMNLGMIKHQGIHGSAIRGDMSFPMIATQDIGAAAALALAEGGFHGFNTRELQGPRNYTMEEVTQIIAQRIGKPDLKYIQFPYAEFERQLVGMGASSDVARNYVELSKAFNEGRAKPLEPRNSQNTTPTRFEDFAEIIPELYERV